MTDNFNLRAFLTENKLTKNTQLLKEEIAVNGKPVDINSIEIDGIDTDDYPDFVDAYIAYAEYEDGTPLTDGELQDFEAENYGLVNELIHDRQLFLQEAAPSAGMSEKEKSALAKKAHAGKDIGKKGAGFAKVEKAAEKQYGSKEAGQKVAAAAMWKNAAKHENVNENTMTEREEYLTRLVENALGFGAPTHDPADSEPIAEEEMVNKEPLPEYKSIDELMSNIEHGTNEAAHKHKMNRMKEVAEMLETKVSSLEEGEHAEHIDQKAVKQMRKDIAALRKAEEKLRKEFDKKFTGKEKKEAPKKETAAEALQEGTFDLRKFLAENRK